MGAAAASAAHQALMTLSVVERRVRPQQQATAKEQAPPAGRQGHAGALAATGFVLLGLLVQRLRQPKRVRAAAARAAARTALTARARRSRRSKARRPAVLTRCETAFDLGARRQRLTRTLWDSRATDCLLERAHRRRAAAEESEGARFATLQAAWLHSKLPDWRTAHWRATHARGAPQVQWADAARPVLRLEVTSGAQAGTVFSVPPHLSEVRACLFLWRWGAASRACARPTSTLRAYTSCKWRAAAAGKAAAVQP